MLKSLIKISTGFLLIVGSTLVHADCEVLRNKLPKDYSFDIPCRFDLGLAPVKYRQKYGFANIQGQIVISPQYDEVSNFYEDAKLAIAKKGNKKGLINIRNESVTDFIYDAIYAPNEFGFNAQQATDSVFFDLKGEKKLQAKNLQGIWYLGKNLGIVMGNHKFGIIQANQHLLVPIEYDLINSFGNDYILVFKRTPYQSTGIFDKTGKWVIPLGKYQEIGSLSNGFATVKSNGKYGFINTNAELIIPPIYDEVSDFNNELALIKRNNQFAFIDTKGNLAINFNKLSDYKSVLSFHQGLSGVCNRRGKCGFINTLGQVVIPLEYDNAIAFNEGFGLVKKHDKWGFIDKNNQTIIPFIYDNAEFFMDGYALVKLNDDIFYINQQGKRVN